MYNLVIDYTWSNEYEIFIIVQAYNNKAHHKNFTTIEPEKFQLWIISINYRKA